MVNKDGMYHHATTITFMVMICTLFLHCVDGQKPSLVDASYTIYNSDLLDMGLKVAKYEYVFDQDLYFPDAVACPPVSKCENPPLEWSDCICDYTSANCGAKISGSDDCVCETSWCNTNLYNWTDITFGQKHITTLPAFEYSLYRVFFNESCRGFRVKLEQEYGLPNLFGSTTSPSPTIQNHQFDFGGGRTMIRSLCPHNLAYKYGTYFLSVYSNIDSLYSIEIELIDSQPLQLQPSDPNSCNVPEELEETHQCVYESVPKHGFCTIPTQQFYMYHFEGCQKIFVYLSSFGTGADMDLFSSRSNPYPYFGDADYSSYLPMDDYLYLSICPPEGEEIGTLYFTVDCWQLGFDFTNFTLYVSSNTSSWWKQRLITEINPHIVPFLLLGTTRFEKPNEDTLVCEHWEYLCDGYWYIYPGSNNNFLWPFPPEFRRINPGLPIFNGYFAWPGDVQVKNNRTFSVALLYEHTVEGSLTKLVEENQLSQIEIQFLDKVTNEDGMPVEGKFRARESRLECSYQSFTETKSLIDNVLDEIDDLEDSSQFEGYRFLADSLQFRDGWMGCQQLLNNLIVSSTTIMPMVTRGCHSIRGSDEFRNDPCCFDVRSWEQTCEPRLSQVPVNNINLNIGLISDQCSNGDCISSFLEDYRLITDEASRGSCSVSQSESNDYYYDMYDKYRFCTNSVFATIECYSDQDCKSLGGIWNQSRCDLIHHQCLIDLDTQEREFVRCILNQMDTSQFLYLRQRFRINGTQDSDLLVDEILGLSRRPGCRRGNGNGLYDIATTDHWRFRFGLACEESGLCPSNIFCPDRTCIIPETSCSMWCGGSWAANLPSQSQCLADQYCNWDAELCDELSSVECEEQCVNQAPTQYFCGICENNQDCQEFALTEEDCAATTVCVLPNGTYALNLTEEECNGIGRCTANCGMECVSEIDPTGNGICYTLAVNDSTGCATVSGNWDAANELCTFEMDREACEADSNRTFERCQDLSIHQCAVCYDPNSCQELNQNVMRCYVNRNIPCETEEECQTAGSCSDAQYLQRWDMPAYGGCVVDRVLPIGDFNGLWRIPFCRFGQAMIPNGCVDYTISKEDCDQVGVWWEPATNQTTCTSRYGCLDVDPNKVYGKQFSFSPKDEGNCTSPWNRDGTWRPLFDWKPARWARGQTRNLQWVRRESGTRNTWLNTIYFPRTESYFFNSAASRLAIQYKSAALCRYSRLSEIVYTVACDCASGDRGGLCFERSIAVPVGEGRPCAGSNYVIPSAGSTLYFNPSSVSNECVSVLVSTISVLLFQEPKQITLSANFVSFRETESFAVLNEKEGVVGVLIGDGVELSITGQPVSFQLCAEIRNDLGETPEKFNIYDFAEYAESATTSFTPLEISTYISQNQLCADLSGIVGKHSYFPIVRVSNWRDEPYRMFETSDLVLIYMLACMFLIVTLLVTVRLGHYGYLMYLRQEKFRQKHVLVIFLWLFNFIRSIYFFVLPGGGQTTVSDYILVVLPTFFYFTTFTLIVVLWAVVSLKRFTADKGEFTRYVKLAALGINVTFYVLFIIIVLVFHYAPSAPPVACEGRVPIDFSETYQTQRDVSIAYATLIGFISLVIGVAFLFFGWRMQKQMLTARRSKSNQRLFLTTTVCSAAFILHCIFILTLAGLEKPNTVFSFIGLIITEIAPSAFILFIFWKMEGNYDTKTNSGSGKRANTTLASIESPSSFNSTISN